VAPLSATPAHSATINVGRGYLKVNALPWAKISVDGVARGVTPFGRPLELAEGSHVIRFEHDWYSPVDKTIDIVPGPAETARAVTVDFAAEKAALKPGKTAPEEPK